MSLDQTTETISHFIGVFHLTVEELRLRDQYDVFKAEKAGEEEVAPPEFTDPKIKSPYELGDYDPSVKYASTADPLPAEEVAVDVPAPVIGSSQPVGDPPDPVQESNWLGSIYPGGSLIILPYVPIPSSVATITFQSLTLFDNDVLGNYADVEFVGVETYYAALEDAAALAKLLNGHGLGLADPLILANADLADLVRETIETFEIPDVEGAVTVVYSKADVEDAAVHGKAIFVNGEATTEAFDLDALLPAFLAEKKAEEEAAAEQDDAEETLADKHEDDAPNPYALDPGHTVVTGANEIVNEAIVTTSWIDAGVIAVGGDVTKASWVSQVNVLSNHDGVGAAGAGLASQALNVFEHTAYPEGYDPDAEPGDAEAAEDADPEGAVPLALPQAWTLETIDSDVLALNSFSQFSFGMDADQVNFGITADATYATTGENQLVNFGQALEIGFGYDLIIVGGNLITLNIISQTNVLLDDDNVSLESGTSASLAGDDNLLVNYASIETHGEDTFEEMQDNFAKAIEDLAEGTEDLAEDVAQDALFAGKDSLKALYIAGDLIKVTLMSQTNIFGDQDQVVLALNDFMDSVGDAAEVIAGSNMLLNSAKIVDYGFDSTVMASGDVYDDLLLYQAELIDTDADPLGVEMSSLANEAVAFLADDMLLPELPEDEGYGGGGQHNGGDAADVMQTMTA